MTTTPTTATLLLGLTAAASLILSSSALPALIPYDSTTLQTAELHNSKLNPQSLQATSSIVPYQDIIINRPSSPFITSPVSPTPGSLSLSSTIFTSPTQATQQQHDFQVHSFLETTTPATAVIIPTRSSSARDMILHRCTTHFLALLDKDISDRLTARLSRLVMMLPVIGVETRSVMRSKVIQVMDEVSLGLTNYDAVRRVIRTAVDDAGLLPYLQEDYHHQYQTKKKTAGRHGSGSGVTIADSAWPSKKARSSRGDGIRRILYYDSEDQETMSEDPKGGIETLDDDDDDNDDGNARESPWFRLSASTTAAHKHRYSAEETDVIDESQIPVVVQVAMEAVIDYIAEILTPTLIIHQLTEAIQDTLHQISRLRALQYPLTDSEQADETTSNTDFDINALSSQSLSQVRGGRDHHGVDLLSDDWVWAFSFAGDGDSGHDGDGETGSDSRGEDEDLWDQDMAINEWDTTGRLFDDFSDADEDDTDAFSSTTNSKESEVDTTGVDDDNVNDGLETYPFSIGIHEGHEPYADEDEDDETLDSGEDYERVRFSRSRGIAKQALFSRFHKRSSVPSDSDNLDSTVEPESQAAQTGLVTTSATHASSKGMDVLSKRRDDAGTFLSRSRRPTFAPDPRLENLLTQLIEPLLTAFIDEEFPASCKRVQGELMDGIIWSLDEGELNGSQWESERDQLALLAELEY